ncbi:HD domain-containing protein [Pseudomonas lijiangensis]|uniref:HD domain-containing protein n=1 Tax=Pseudomonas lijiangensis TaxID=2995658 RepID=UPI0031BB16B1
MANSPARVSADSEKAVHLLFELCRQQAEADYLGEDVSQLEHMVQAAELAIAEGADDELVLAAFCHDVGHFCTTPASSPPTTQWGHKEHEKVGAQWLRELGFPLRLCGLVERHVDAKRYLCCREHGYLQSLSEASLQTMAWQGGPMTEEQATLFERGPLFADSLRLRRWDEAAKVTGRQQAELHYFVSLAYRVHEACSDGEV